MDKNSALEIIMYLLGQGVSYKAIQGIIFIDFYDLWKAARSNVFGKSTHEKTVGEIIKLCENTTDEAK